MGASLYSLCVSCGFGGRVGFDVNVSHVFAVLLAAIILVGGEVGEGGIQGLN